MPEQTLFFTKDSAKGAQIYAAFLAQCPNVKTWWSYMGSWSQTVHTFKHSCTYNAAGFCAHGLTPAQKYIQVVTQC